MEYVGIYTQQRRNNTRSVLLLCLFPCLVVGLLYLFCFLFVWCILSGEGYEASELSYMFPYANGYFIHLAPYVLGGVLIWFVVAYFANVQMIQSATGAKPLERKDNKRVYNLVENLCISQGMKMPKINIIYDDSLNAFASGINDRTYTVTLSKGIIDKLDDEELEAVIAHELTHIRNRDVRLLIVSIVFVGIFAMIAELTFRTFLYAPRRRSNNDNGRGGGIIVAMLLAMIVAAIGYFFAILMRFAISRKREFMADAGSAEMTHNPRALASALRKISKDPDIEAVTRDDVAQLFIEHPGKQVLGLSGLLGGLFATHPPIEERIRILEQF